MNVFVLIFLVGCLGAVLFSKLSISSVMGCMYLYCLVLFPSSVKVFGFSPSTIVTYLTLLYALYQMFVEKKNNSADTLHIVGVFAIFSVAFLFTLPFSASMSFLNQLTAVKQFLLDLLVPLSLVVLLRKHGECISIQKFALILVLVTCVYGVYTYAIGTNLYSLLVQIYYPEANDFEKYMEEERAGLEGRIGGFIGHPVFYAGMMMIFFYLVLYFSLQMMKKKNRAWFFFSVVCMLAIAVNLFLTGTRSAMVAVAVGLAYYCVRVLSYSKLMIIGASIVGVIGVMATFPIFGKYQPMVDSIVYFWDDDKTSGEIKGSSVSMRLNQLEGTFDIISGPRILFGNGAGWIRKYMEKNGKHPVLLGFESLLFSGLVQYGVLGFLLMYGGLFGSMVYVNERLNGKRDDRYLVNAYVLSYVVYAFLTGAYDFSAFLMIYGFLVKSILCSEKENKLRTFFLLSIIAKLNKKKCQIAE